MIPTIIVPESRDAHNLLSKDLQAFEMKDNAWWDRLKARLIKRMQFPSPGQNKCVLWSGKKDNKGYGRLSLFHRTRGHYVPTLAHRLVYMAFVNREINGLCVCHSCDNPSCVLPEHLFLGTQADNVKDMLTKGRDRSFCAINRNKKYCNKGHLLSGDNLLIEGKAKARRCKSCKKIVDLNKPSRISRLKCAK